MKVVLLPSPVFGHLIPFYLLAKALASRPGVQVYYVANLKDIQRLRELSPESSSSFTFIELSMPLLPGNPSRAVVESVINVPKEKKLLELIKAYDHLKQPFKHFVVRNKPEWLIIDIDQDWAVSVAQECNIHLMSFLTTSAASSVVMASFSNSIIQNITSSSSSGGLKLQDLTSPPRQVTFPSKVAFSHFEVTDFLQEMGAVNNTPPVSSFFRIISKFIQRSQAIAIRSCKEVESDYLSVLSEMVPSKVPLIPVGFLPPPPPPANTYQIGAERIIAWLDEQKPKSVVYVGFGSQIILKTEQILEVAHGLEESEFPFLLVLGNDNIGGSGAALLPSGFLHRTAFRGKVFFGWAPQWVILAHPAVGGFLSHGGWGSVTEALFFGHSLVILPVANDEPLNARLLVEKGLATEVHRNEIDGSFTRKDIVKCLKQAMAPQGGGEETMRSSAKEIYNMVGDHKLHDLYVDDLVKFMQGKSGRGLPSSL